MTEPAAIRPAGSYCSGCGKDRPNDPKDGSPYTCKECLPKGRAQRDGMKVVDVRAVRE